jgi:SRSO17 transposase
VAGRPWPVATETEKDDGSSTKSTGARPRPQARGGQGAGTAATGTHVADGELARATHTTLTSRFAALRVRAAHRDYWRSSPREEEWLLIEWPNTEPEPIKYRLATLAADTPLKTLVDTAMMRWRIERDYQELKQEFGLSHYEGRGWRGFHHHATLCIAAYGFLVTQRLKQSGPKKTSARATAPALPKGYAPRGGRKNPTARSLLDRHTALPVRTRNRQAVGSLSMLRTSNSEFHLVTQ